MPELPSVVTVGVRSLLETEWEEILDANRTGDVTEENGWYELAYGVIVGLRLSGVLWLVLEEADNVMCEGGFNGS